MQFSIIRMSKTELEVELDELDPTLTELIAEKLNTYKDVEFAASKWEHPLVGNPKLFVKAKKDPLKLVEKAIDELEKELKKIDKEL
jgi:DNA-directed RNA polymerase subunit L